MTEQSIAQSPLIFNPCSIPEVYKAIRIVHGIAASQMTPAVVSPFIPEGACPLTWSKNMRDHEWRLANPKPRPRKRRRSAGATPRNGDFVRLALSQLEVAS